MQKSQKNYHYKAVMYLLRGINGKRVFRFFKFLRQPRNVLLRVNKRGGIHFFLTRSRFLADFFTYTGGPFANGQKMRFFAQMGFLASTKKMDIKFEINAKFWP